MGWGGEGALEGTCHTVVFLVVVVDDGLHCVLCMCM